MSRASVGLIVGILVLMSGRAALGRDEAATRGVAPNVMRLGPAAQDTPSPSSSAPTSSVSPSPSPAGGEGRSSTAGFIVLGLLLGAFLLLRTKLLRRGP